jgi:hypothetical protein
LSKAPAGLGSAALAVALAVGAAAAGQPRSACGEPTAQTAGPTRVEARSADLVAVGVLRGDRMTIHLSAVIDNAPVRDASVNVVLRGAVHPTVAEADGSYTLQTKDLALPGAAVVEFQVASAAMRETLKGTLQVNDGSNQADNKNSARQLWWWVLNFAVCIGFLWLISRRRKKAAET